MNASSGGTIDPSGSGASVGRAAAIGFSALLVGVGLGRFGYPPLIPAVVEAQWTTAEVAHLAAATNLAGYLIGALAAAWITDRLGARVTILCCLWLTVASFALSAAPLHAFPFIALRCLSGVTGGVLMSVVAPIVAAMVDPSRRGAAGGFSFAGIGVGFVLSGTLVPAMAGHALAWAWMSIAAILSVASLTAWRALPAGLPSARRPQMIAARPARSGLAMAGLGAAYMCSAAGFVPHTVVFVDYVARVLGYGLTVGGLMWIATGIGAIVSPPIAGMLADRIGFAPTLRLVLGAMAIGTVIPAVTSSTIALVVSAVLAGGLMIALASLVAGRARELTPAERHAAVWGRLTVLFALMQAIAAYATSGFLSSGGSYTWLFMTASAISAAGLLVEIVTNGRSRHPDGNAEGPTISSRSNPAA